MSTYHQQLQQMFHKYELQHGAKPTQLTDVAAWMIANGHWQMKPTDAIHRCAEDIANALRDEYRTDAKGRRYRANHAVREMQGTFWADLDQAPRAHMEKAFAQRRKQVVGDCVQLKTDVDAFNDKHSDEKPINLVLDFTYDVEEVHALQGRQNEAA